MGKFSKGILGGFSGTVGTVVGANWRGMDVMRSRPKKSKSASSPLQEMQRQKFALAIKFQNALRSMQSRLYGERMGIKSRVNLAASYLLKEVVTEADGTPVLVMEKVLITKGNLPGFSGLAVEATAGAEISFLWEDNSSASLAQADDLFCTAVYEDESATFEIMEGPATRVTASFTMPLPQTWAGKKVHVYAFFQNAAQNAASTSVYLGEVVLV